MYVCKRKQGNVLFCPLRRPIELSVKNLVLHASGLGAMVGAQGPWDAAWGGIGRRLHDARALAQKGPRHLHLVTCSLRSGAIAIKDSTNTERENGRVTVQARLTSKQGVRSSDEAGVVSRLSGPTFSRGGMSEAECQINNPCRFSRELDWKYISFAAETRLGRCRQVGVGHHMMMPDFVCGNRLQAAAKQLRP